MDFGEVGIENWILQNGGSFEEATKEFLKASKGKSFEEFKKDYKIWDFGGSHMRKVNKNQKSVGNDSEKENTPCNNFVANNMSKEGYKKMQNALEKYITKLHQQKRDRISSDFDEI